ncbi:MAG: invertase [Rhodospirillaceae bacterium]|nr:invertase [Rhodospirillaceae bacterium]
MTCWPFIECRGRRVGYARVSTRDQKLRMQLDALKAVECSPIFRDHGVSGAKGERPGLDRMLNDLRPGDTVVVFKLDRLGRSVLHLSDLLVRFAREDIHFCSLSEGINTTTPGGKLVYHVFAAVAEFQREIIVENTLGGLEAARRRGTRLGRPRALEPDDVVNLHRLLTQENADMEQLAERFSVSPVTVTRAFRRHGLEV